MNATFISKSKGYFMENNNNSRIQQIIAHLAGAASVAADGVTDAVQTAGNVVGEKYDSIKLTIEIRKLQDEQTKLFSDIGRALFIVKNGKTTATSDDEGAISGAQDEIDRILELASEKQAEIDTASQKLADLQGTVNCSDCGKATDTANSYCPSCGASIAKPEE